MPKVQPHDTAEELRQAVREANGVLKDLRAERKAAERIAVDIAAGVEMMAREVVREFQTFGAKCMAEGMAEASSALRMYVAGTEERLSARFEELTTLLLGPADENELTMDEVAKIVRKIDARPIDGVTALLGPVASAARRRESAFGLPPSADGAS